MARYAPTPTPGSGRTSPARRGWAPGVLLVLWRAASAESLGRGGGSADRVVRERRPLLG